MSRTTITRLAGACLITTVGCGGSPSGTATTGATSGTTGAGGAGDAGSSSTATGAGGSSPATGTGGSGASCQPTDLPITPNPWTDVNCNAATVTTAGHPLEVARVPGWAHPILVDQVTILASPKPLDGTCSLDSNDTLLVTVAGDMPTAPASAWIEVPFNPKIPSNGSLAALAAVVVDLPPQLVNPGQNLFVAMKTAGDQGRFCFSACQNQSDWTWAGSDLGALAPTTYQARLTARGNVKLACEPLHNNDATCPPSFLSSIAAGKDEDGDLVVERLVAGADILVSEILFEMNDDLPCTLPDNVEILYFVGDPAAPKGSVWTEAKAPKASAYRIANGLSVFSLPVNPPLLVPAGQALYGGIRQHPSPGGTCIATCSGPDAAAGDSWWGHTHLQPGAVVWKSLASENFTRSLRLSAVYTAK